MLQAAQRHRSAPRASDTHRQPHNMGLFHIDHDHTCLDTNAEPIATRISPVAPPNVYGPLPSLNDWLKRVLKREVSREQLDALVANGVRRPFHLATLSTESRLNAASAAAPRVPRPSLWPRQEQLDSRLRRLPPPARTQCPPPSVAVLGACYPV